MTTDDNAPLHELGRWLESRRWYGDKGRQLTAVTTVFRAGFDVASESLAVEIARVGYRSGAASDYLLLRDPRNAERDALGNPEARAWLLDGFAAERVLEDERGARLVWRPRDSHGSDWLALARESRVFRGEQSNTSIIYDDRAIMKIFRKLRKGVNPEVEICEFLASSEEFEAFPRLLGTIDLDAEDRTTTIASVQEFVPSLGDAWSWLTDRIRDPEIRERTVEAARVLGVRTGQMHRAFAAGRSEGFVPEVASGAYAEAIRGEAQAELRDTIDQLERRGTGGAVAMGEALDGALDALLELEGTVITRIHGDYHLGQVLRTRDEDFTILDFEGEPTRPLAERRSKASPLRDVAAMLRSFDYAAETGRRVSPDGVAAIDAWYVSSRDAFMDGYDATVRESSVLMRGWEPHARPAVLAAFELHKALYEVRYELMNRPDWLGIPLNALRRLAGVDAGGRHT